ncbi:hypothetical protein DKG34_37585 [Streptomyces sp. NWU49]|nr:hypothetical protein DKG34_37585 [Streptomyces sp. NWU49]
MPRSSAYGAGRTGEDITPAYAMAHSQSADPRPDIAEYIERIPATFEPYGGRFLVHATEHEVKEGTWPGHVVVIGFPGITEARTWWDSPAYQEVAPLRSRHVEGDIILVEGVPDDYDATATAKAVREALAADRALGPPSVNGDRPASKTCACRGKPSTRRRVRCGTRRRGRRAALSAYRRCRSRRAAGAADRRFPREGAS